MTYNVRVQVTDFWELLKGVDEWEGRHPAKAVETMIAQNPDVFGLQEVTDLWLSDYLGSLTSTHGYSVYTGKGFDNRYQPIYYKTSKYTLVSSGVLYLSDTPDTKSKYSDADYYRYMSYAILRDNSTGVCFAFVNAHVQAHSESTDVAVRNLQAAALVGILNRNTFSNLPIILIGDFNSIETGVPYNLITGSTTRMVDSETISAKVTNNQNTLVNRDGWSTLFPYVFDYIFVTNDLISVSDYAVVDNKIDNNNTTYPSDHLPVYSIITIYEE